MPTTCRICNGTGKAPAMPEAGINFEMDPCPRCQGSGQELTVSDVGAAGDASGEPMPDPQELARIGEQRRKKMLYDASLRGLESEEQQTRDLQDKLETGEPMDIAWQLLKRQTELGEFHPDLPSSMGPVVVYHGKGLDDDRRKKFQTEGILPIDTETAQVGSGRYVDSDYDTREAHWNKDIPANVSTTGQIGVAQDYAESGRKSRRGQDAAVYGVRAGALVNQLPMDDPRRGSEWKWDEDLREHVRTEGGREKGGAKRYRFIAGGIKPEALTEMGYDDAKDHALGNAQNIWARWDNETGEMTEMKPAFTHDDTKYESFGPERAYQWAWDQYRAENQQPSDRQAYENWIAGGHATAHEASEQWIDDQVEQWKAQQAAQAGAQAELQQRKEAEAAMKQPDWTNQTTLYDNFQTGEPMEIAMQLLKEDEASLATADTVIPEEYAFDYYGTNPYTNKHFGIGSYTDPNDPTQRIKIPFYQRSGSGQGGGGEGQPVGGDWAPFFGFDIEGGNFSGLLGGVPQSNKAGWQIKPGDGTTGHALEGFDNTMSRYGTKDLANLGRWLNENVDPARFGESQYTDKAALNQWLVEQGARVDDVARGVRRDKPGGIPWKRAEPMDLAWQLLKYNEDAEWYYPNTFDADELRAYNRYLMDNFFDKLPEEVRDEVGMMMFFIEKEEQALRAGDESYMGLMTPEYAIGNINAILQEHGLITQDMGGV